MTNNTLLRADFEHTFSLFTFYARSKGITFITTSFLRSAEQQAELYAIGRTVDLDKKPVTDCDGYKKISKHQRGRAKDILIITPEGKEVWDHVPEYDVLGKLWEYLGGIWGGDWYKAGKTTFDDCYHFEDGYE